MSNLLSSIFEDESVQEYVDSNTDSIMEAAEYFHQTPQVIKDYMLENLDTFIVSNDLKATYENMVSFVTSNVVSVLDDLTDQIVG